MLLLAAMPYTFYIKILNSIGIIIEARKAVTITITVSPQIQIITGNGIEKYTRTFPSPIWTLTSSINLTIRRQPLPPSHIVQTGLKREPARSECIRDRSPSLKAYLSDISLILCHVHTGFRRHFPLRLGRDHARHQHHKYHQLPHTLSML